MRIIKWFKTKFKTVYCDECEHMNKGDDWYGQHDCHASPYVWTERTRSLSKRPKTIRYEGYHFAEKVKIFPWCSKYKKLTD